MCALGNRIPHFENHIDTSIKKFIFHRKILGAFLLFMGMPLATLAAVCLCIIIIAWPVAFVFGWT